VNLKMFTSLISLRVSCLVFIIKLTEMEFKREAGRRTSSAEGIQFADEIEMQAQNSIQDVPHL